MTHTRSSESKVTPPVEFEGRARHPNKHKQKSETRDEAITRRQEDNPGQHQHREIISFYERRLRNKHLLCFRTYFHKENCAAQTTSKNKTTRVLLLKIMQILATKIICFLRKVDVKGK